MMDALTILQLLGWLAVGLVMCLFAITGGFDLGAGILLPFLGRREEERRVVINTVGPTWDGNQVWLIIVGGAIFAIWPRVYAASFSGFYFAILLVLWSLFLRPVSFEYRSKLNSLGWRRFWDYALFVGSLLPALLIGVAIGNVLEGVPFEYDAMSLRFQYDGSFWGLLRGFPFVVGFVSLFMIAMHGAAYLQLRTEGIVYERARRAFIVCATLFILLFIAAGLYIGLAVKGYHLVQLADNPMRHPLENIVTVGVGEWMRNYVTYPWMLVAPIVGLLGALAGMVAVFRDARRFTFIASLLSVVGVVLTFGFTMFPFVMPSSLYPAQSLLVWNATSSAKSLLGILICAVVMLPIILIYTLYVYHHLWKRDRRMSVALVKEETHTLY